MRLLRTKFHLLFCLLLASCQQSPPPPQDPIEEAYQRCVQKSLADIESRGGAIDAEIEQQMAEIAEKTAQTSCLRVKERCRRSTPDAPLSPQCLTVLKEFEKTGESNNVPVE